MMSCNYTKTSYDQDRIVNQFTTRPTGQRRNGLSRSFKRVADDSGNQPLEWDLEHGGDHAQVAQELVGERDDDF